MLSVHAVLGAAVRGAMTRAWVALALSAVASGALGAPQGRKGGTPPLPPPPEPPALGEGSTSATAGKARAGVPEPPPAELLLDPDLALPWVLDERLCVDVACRTLERRLSLAWRYAVDGEERPAATAQSWLPLSYWPTRICPLDRNHLAIGGLNGSGETLIEVLEFSDARVMAGAPDAAGNPTVAIEPGTWVGSSDVYRAATPGRSFVCALLPLSGRERGLIVQFWDSSDVYALDWGTGGLELLVSPRAGAALPAEPLLAERRELSTSGRHQEHGACYVLAASRPGVKIIVLRDAQGDGTLDHALALSAEEWRVQGWGDPARWTEVPPLLGRVAAEPAAGTDVVPDRH